MEAEKEGGEWGVGQVVPAGLGALAEAEPTSVGKGVRFSCSTAPSTPWPGRLTLATKTMIYRNTCFVPGSC